MTNVKAGDLAIVVRASNPGNLHIIVRVIEAASVVAVEGGPAYVRGGDIFHADLRRDGAVWWVESLGRPFILEMGFICVARQVVAAQDVALRPLRDTDEPDQMPRVTDKELTT